MHARIALRRPTPGTTEDVSTLCRTAPFELSEAPLGIQNSANGLFEPSGLETNPARLLSTPPDESCLAPCLISHGKSV